MSNTDNTPEKPKVILENPQEEFDFGDNGELYKTTTQYIPPSLIEANKKAKMDSMGQREGEYMRVASIPVAIVEKWQREGFDIFQVDGKEIIKRLHAEGLDGFILTNKSL